ncbi:NAD(P)-dependent alcohol dehydrogenase [Candidatus Odyssella acanthamoebae]|uniref:Hydroxyacid dehydrogenase n=1 Tax=Candidatus Odyssella acanthamoebae TaxID=91604 RepID=A0A077AZH0_9PROT|nr:NAD(P)-dependent alcohol dehydrogenase [Candidatus Paracaedibacter acanthamoebae]AIK97088.1 hydroxyacid dehydrogenase [Candidatus Paracaedibacter acanthamoebae]
MAKTTGYAVNNATSPFSPFTFDRREPGEHDVEIDILYSGVCHSDIHQVRNEWGGSRYPMVPGHEIVGTVTRVGSKVKKFKVGDTAGVGCFVDSCRTCHSCEEGLEQYCEKHLVQTYNSLEHDMKTPTYGGYSKLIVVDENYTLKVPEFPDLSRVAPLLCAGITTYSPLRHWKVGKGHKVAVMGLGGLGHMAVKLAVSMGADVTVLSRSKHKEADAKKLGAHHFVLTSEPDAFVKNAKQFDFIVNVIAAAHDTNAYLNLLKREGVMIVLGAPDQPVELDHHSLIINRRKIAGSLIGGIQETQEMLNYCASHKIMADVEVIPMNYIETAYERMIKGDVTYRFVIDMKTL